jgi:phenylacetate-CoA ligase
MAKGEVTNRYFDQARETKPWPERQTDLERRFVETWSYVWNKSRAYRAVYSAAGLGEGEVRGLGDLARLPLLRISDLALAQREYPPFGGFEIEPPEGFDRVYINPGLIFQPGCGGYHDTSWAEGLCGAGFEPGDLVLNTFNYHLWPYAFMLDESVRSIGGTVIPTGVGNTLMQVRIMEKLKVNAFMGTPSFLNTLSQRAEHMGFDLRRNSSLTKAMVGAEMLPESLRDRLEKKLGITIRQTYGTVFLGCIGYECVYKTGLHVPDNVLVEVVDPETGRPVPAGASGEIVATVFNPGYPAVRFGTGDQSLFHREQCPCGRTGPMLKRILGRMDQATKVRGTFVHPWQTDEVISRFPEVFKYQVQISRGPDENDQMIFVVELTDESMDPGRLQGRLERDIKELLTVKGLVKVVPRGTIPDFHSKLLDRRTWE